MPKASLLPGVIVMSLFLCEQVKHVLSRGDKRLNCCHSFKQLSLQSNEYNRKPLANYKVVNFTATDLKATRQTAHYLFLCCYYGCCCKSLSVAFHVGRSGKKVQPKRKERLRITLTAENMR